MHATRFFLAPEWPQSVALDRIARWKEFTTSCDSEWQLRHAMEAEEKKTRPRRSVLSALKAAHKAAAERVSVPA